MHINSSFYKKLNQDASINKTFNFKNKFIYLECLLNSKLLYLTWVKFISSKKHIVVKSLKNK